MISSASSLASAAVVGLAIPSSLGSGALPVTPGAAVLGRGDLAGGAPPAFAACLGRCLPAQASETDTVTAETPEDLPNPAITPEPSEAVAPWFWSPPPPFAPPPPVSVTTPGFPPVAPVLAEEPVSALPAEGAAATGVEVVSGRSGEMVAVSSHVVAGEVDRRGKPADGESAPPASPVGKRGPDSDPAVTSGISRPDTTGPDTARPDRVQVPTSFAPMFAAVPKLAVAPADAAATATVGTFGAAEQIAARIRAVVSQDGEAVVSENKNITEKTDKNIFKESNSIHGIASAYEVSAMSSVSAHSSPAGRIVASAPIEPPCGGVESAAVRLVERVTEVADLVRDTPAERVTLNLDLDDSHRVEVRVAVRAGRVHAEFRSDSAEVRTALSSAWESFTTRPDSGSRAWAEPVFSALGATATASPVDPARAVGSSSGSAADAFGHEPTGQGSSRRDQTGRSRPDADATGAGFFSASKNPVVVQSSSTSRDPHRLLSVQA
jgi:hypothetical protein